MTKDEKIEAILKKARKPVPEIAEIRHMKGTDGKFYSAFGFPIGVEFSGEIKVAGFAYRSNDGTTYGKRFATREEAISSWESSQNGQMGAFRYELMNMSAARLESQYEYWSKK